MSLFNKTEKCATGTGVTDALSIISEDVNPRHEIKYGKPQNACLGLLMEYSDNSSIHGVKYLGERKRPAIERLFWTGMIIGSLSICIILIINTYDKWERTPVIVSFAEKSTPVWEIPFPGVTVCPVTKAKKDIFNYTATYCRLHNESIYGKENYFMDAMSQVCYYHNVMEANMKKFGTKTSSKNSIVEALTEMAPQFDEIFEECFWLNTNRNCSELFHPVVTEEGICYSFNLLSPSEVYRNGSFYSFDFNHTLTDWTLEDGYQHITEMKTYPERVYGSDESSALYTALSGSTYDRDHLCRESLQGFKVILNTAGVKPSTRRNYVHVPFGQEVIIKVKPNMIKTMPSLKNYKPDRRLCFFKHERTLQHFKVYTQANCNLECLTNYTLYKCGCVKFSMPRRSDTPVCGARSISCLKAAEDNLAKAEFFRAHGLEHDLQRDCHCLPTCTSITYDLSVSFGEFDATKLKQMRNCGAKTKDLSKFQLSRFVVFFIEDQFITSRRSELYGFTDFVANCGGILGLFMGFSLLSLVEIIYYCSLRLVHNLKMRFDAMERRSFNNNLERSARNSVCNSGKE